MHRDAHLSYKRYKVLENFVVMAIQGTQVSMYTKHTLFLYFSNFSNLFIYLFFIFIKAQNKEKLKINKQKPLNKVKHKLDTNE